MLRRRWSAAWQIMVGIYHWVRDGIGQGAGSAAPAAGARAGPTVRGKGPPGGRGAHRAQPAWTHLVRPEQCLPTIQEGEPLRPERLTELVAAREPDVNYPDFEMRVHVPPTTTGKMPVGHGAEDNLVDDSQRCGRDGKPGCTSMELSLKRTRDSKEEGAPVPEGQLSCGVCSRVFSMNGTWMSCFCCPTLTCCTSCKLRHDALYCWVVADSGRFTAKEYDDATKQFFRPCCIHHQRTDSSKWEHYQACFQCQQMVCID